MNRCSTCGRELELASGGLNFRYCPNGCLPDTSETLSHFGVANPFAPGAVIPPRSPSTFSHVDLPAPINYRGEAVAVQFKGNTVCGASYEEALGKLLLQILASPGDQITITRQHS